MLDFDFKENAPTLLLVLATAILAATFSLPVGRISNYARVVVSCLTFRASRVMLSVTVITNDRLENLWIAVGIFCFAGHSH